MIDTLHIRGFRAFESLTLTDLSPVTLLVGPNNAGKSTVLEAFELLLGRGTTSSFKSLVRRNECGVGGADSAGRTEPSFVHFFHNHRFNIGASFMVEGITNGIAQRLEFEIVGKREDAANASEKTDPVEAVSPTSADRTPYGLKIRRNNGVQIIYKLTVDGSFDSNELGTHALANSETLPSFVFLDSNSKINIEGLWNEIVLGPEEQQVVNALRIIEPRVERVASIRLAPGHSASRVGTSGFVVKLKDCDRRLPLGSMGDGIRRLLEISICIANAAGGYLLVDEIDSGLHHSTMLNLWKMVVETARRLNVQVVATTHSADCVRALAELYDQDPETAANVCVHRIEKDREHSVRFSASEIRAAVEQEMELR